MVNKIKTCGKQGQNIGFNKRYEKEVKRRIEIGWSKFQMLKKIFKNTFSPKIKSGHVPSVRYLMDRKLGHSIKKKKTIYK